MRNRVRSAGGLAAGGVIRTEEHRRQDRRRYMETMRTIALLALSASLAQAAVLPRLRVSENGRFFIQEGGAPFLYLGDTEWTLLQCTRDDVDTYLADRAAKKFTVVQISVAGFDALKKMFVDGDPARPNEEYFRFLDYVVRKAESVGLYVALAPMWSNGYVRPELNVLNDATAFSYGKYLGTRYRDTSVIWILGGDFFATGFEDIWRRMAAGLTEGDGGVHPRSGQAGGGRRGGLRRDRRRPEAQNSADRRTVPQAVGQDHTRLVVRSAARDIGRESGNSRRPVSGEGRVGSLSVCRVTLSTCESSPSLRLLSAHPRNRRPSPSTRFSALPFPPN